MQVRSQVQSMQTMQSVQATNSLSEEARASNLQQFKAEADFASRCITLRFSTSILTELDKPMDVIALSAIWTTLYLSHFQSWTA